MVAILQNESKFRARIRFCQEKGHDKSNVVVQSTTPLYRNCKKKLFFLK